MLSWPMLTPLPAEQADFMMYLRQGPFTPPEIKINIDQKGNLGMLGEMFVHKTRK